MRPIYLIIACLLAGAAQADPQPVGYVKNVSGSASITTDSSASPAAVGAPVFEGSVLRTGADGSLGLVFKDETVMSFGPDTELTVEEYLYAPAQGKLRFGSRLSRGSLNYVSGVIAKLQPDAVSVTTPSGVIGVRGTQFLVKVAP